MTKNYFLLFCFLSLHCFSQSFKQKVADKYYNQLAFEKAAPLYAELATKNNTSTDVLRKAATSYRLLSKSLDAEIMYSKLILKPDATNSDVYNYAQVLRLNGKYKEADSQMKKIHSVDQSNTVAKRHANVDYDYIVSIKKDSMKFDVKNLLNLNSSESDFSPAFYNNYNEIVFSSNRENHGANNQEFAWDNTSFLDIYITKIDTATQTVDKPEKFDRSLKSTYHDGPISFSPDGKTMIVTRSNFYDKKLHKSSSNIVNVQMYYATKKSDNWGDLKPFPYNNKDYNFGHACFSLDGKTVYFVSDMPGTYGNTDIWETDFDGTNFTQPKNLGQQINTEGREMFPFVDDDNLLLFASDGFLGLGGLDIHIASVVGLPSYIGNIGYPINTNYDDFGLIYNTKTLKGYFTSNRSGGKGKDDIYSVKFKESLLGSTIQGVVYDNITKNRLSNSLIYLYDKNGNAIDSTITDSLGKFSLVGKRVNELSKIDARKSSYFDGHITPKSDDAGIFNLYLDPKYKMICTVYDSKDNSLLDSVQVSLFHTIKSNNREFLTDSLGKIFDELQEFKKGDEIEAVVRFEKKGYVTTLQDLSFKLDTSLVINLNEYLKTDLQKLEMGIDISKSININPIYFDVNKSVIRVDAALELDKIVTLMKENPTVVIELGSHTDCRASKEYNMKLSSRRAKSSADYIISKGISKSRIYGKGYGESKLLNRCECEEPRLSMCSEDEHQLNRRTEFVIVKF